LVNTNSTQQKFLGLLTAHAVPTVTLKNPSGHANTRQKPKKKKKRKEEKNPNNNKNSHQA